jgi:putative ABC transport system permease protein
VTQAAGFIYGNQTVGAGASATDANLFGVEPGMVGTPVPDTGRQPAGNSEAMVDDALPYAIGQRFVVGSDTFTVVGLLHRSTLLSGTPNVFITLAAAQQLMFGGRPLVTAVVSRGVPSGRPANLQVLTPAQVTANMKVPLAKAAQVVGFIEIFLWLIAACIIGSVIYVSALEKTRDFAVLKATGASDGQLMVTLGLQAVIISVAAAVAAVILAVLLAPVFPIVVVIPVWAVLLLPLLAVVLGLMASTAGLRRAVGVEPALAFGGP